MDRSNPVTGYSDQALFLACRAGNAQAWATLVAKYERLVYSIPLNYGLSVEDAADLCQEVFLILLKSLDSLTEESNLCAWLVTVTRRHTWRLLKRRQLLPIEPLASEVLDILMPHHPKEFERYQVIEWLHQELADLGERCRLLLIALYFERDKPSYQAIAQRLGIAEGSIGPTRARCLQKLKEILTRKLDYPT
jgi:RNA polymerase sigma factor (sigma-70 family)